MVAMLYVAGTFVHCGYAYGILCYGWWSR